MIDNISALIGKSLEDIQAQLELEHRLKENYLYMLIDVDNDKIQYFYNKDTKVSQSEYNDLYKYLQVREVYGEYIDSNKSILNLKIKGTRKDKRTSKKLDSANMYCYFALTKTILTELSKSGGTIEDFAIEIINDYCDCVKNKFIDYYKEYIPTGINKKTKQLLLQRNFQEEIDIINNNDRIARIEYIRKYLINNIAKILDILKLHSKAKSRIFIKAPLEVYKSEFHLYLKGKCFNSKTTYYNDGKIYGASTNLTLSPKKPTIKNLTKNIEIPHLVTIDEAYKLHFINLYLDTLNYNCQLSYNNYSHLNIKFGKNERGRYIKEYDNIPLVVNNTLINCCIYNILHIVDTNKQIVQPTKILTLEDLEKQLNYKLFNNQLVYNYHTDEIKISSKITSGLRDIIYKYRTLLYQYLKCNNKISDNTIIRMTYKLISEQFKIAQNNYKICEAINFGLSFIDFYNNNEQGGIIMKIKELHNIMIEKINDNTVQEIETDVEYYYYIGKIIKYLLRMNEGNDKTYQMVKPFLSIRNNKMLKCKILTLVKKYSYKIHQADYRLNNCLKMINNYEINDKITEDNQMILITSMMDNVNELYNSKKKTKNTNKQIQEDK